MKISVKVLCLLVGISACARGASNISAASENILANISVGDFFSLFDQAQKAPNVNQVRAAAASVDIMDHYRYLLANTTDATVVIGNHRFSGLRSQLVAQESFYRDMHSKYKTMGRWDASKGLKSGKAMSLSDLNKSLDMMDDQVNHKGGLGLLDAAGDLDKCQKAALSKSGCDTAGQALGAAAPASPAPAAAAPAAPAPAGTKLTDDEPGFALANWASIGTKVSNTVSTGAKVVLPSLQAASGLCSAIAGSVHTANNCAAVTSAVNAAGSNAASETANDGGSFTPSTTGNNDTTFNCTDQAKCVNVPGSGNTINL